MREKDHRIVHNGYSRRINGTFSAHCKLQLIEQDALASKAGQVFEQIVADITADLGGAELLSTMERHLVLSFAAAAMLQGQQHTKILSGQPLNPHEFVSVSLAMQRTAKILGFSRRAKSINAPNLRTYLEQGEAAE